MPRQSRNKSESGYYHVLLRGIGQQSIFEDDNDRIRFLETIKRYKEELGYELHAYCLMSNHVHLLVKDINNRLELMMKKIAVSYAYYFNWKYERIGHLFQDRFKSEVIENDSYFLTVLRYIHRNPLKAKISKVEDYKWSSYQDYIGISKLTDTEVALEMLGGKDGFVEFVHKFDDSECLDVTDAGRLTDEKALAIIKKILNSSNPLIIQNMNVEDRNKYLRLIKGSGISIRQIERLTGINRNVIQRS